MSDPAWMRPPQPRPDHKPLTGHEADSHLLWPQNAADSHNISAELATLLQQRQGTGCQIVKYSFKRNVWRFDRATKSVDDIKDMVSAVDPSEHGNLTASAFL